MTLNEWQGKLTAYFAELRSTLNASGNPRPIFALEHNLSPAELMELTVCLRDHTNSSGPAARHYHAWSVYAAEIGYRFKGDEYWQTFGEGLPNWKDVDRDCIKDAFYDFKRAFRGATPTGDWARNFTIICWPITHAVLPMDLQRHLANLLYEVRGAFTPDLLNNTSALGRLIAANSEGKSDRFRKFTEEYDLVGRIALALLSPESEAAAGLLASHTLNRIARDLQAEQNAHAWLSAARQRASTVKMSGLKTRTTVLGFPLPETPEPDAQPSEQAPQERLELIIKQTGDETWSVVVRMPNLAHVESSNSMYQRAFTSQRSYIDDSGKSHFAPRYFTINHQDVVLRRWPEPSRSIIRFEPSPFGLSALLDNICSLPTLSSALFRLRDDGTGVYVKSKVLRPGESYVLIRKGAFASGTYLRESKRVSVDCSGLAAILLDVPNRISDPYREAVTTLGLTITLALTVRPAGYPPTFWNGEGEVKWSENSPKILAVTSTVQVKGLALNLSGNGQYQIIQANMDGYGPVYVDLETVKAGQYVLTLAAQVGSVEEKVVTGTATVSIIPNDDLVLSPQSAQGFSILATPTLPTFDELWAGAAKINIFGPRDSQLKSHLSFFSDPSGRTPPLLTHSLGKVVLPVDESDWTTIFERVKKDKRITAAQEDAVSCRLTWRSAELGESFLHFEREFVPFRWSVRTRNTYHKVRLIQNDSSRQLQLEKATFTAPAVFTPLVLSAKLDFEQADEGGLFVARSEGSAASVILTSPAVTGFSALKPPTEARLPTAKDGESLLRLCEALGLWTGAQFADDPFLRVKRRAAVRMLRTALLESICGGLWTAAETALEQGRLRVSNICGMIGPAKDYKFHRSVSEAIAGVSMMTDGELTKAVVAFAQSYHLIRGSHTEDVLQHDLVGAFASLLRTGTATENSWVRLTVAACQIAMIEPDLMRLMRLFLLARETAMADQRLLEAVTQ